METFDSMCMGHMAARCNVLYFGACILCKFNIFIIYYIIIRGFAEMQQHYANPFGAHSHNVLAFLFAFYKNTCILVKMQCSAYLQIGSRACFLSKQA
jgi:hypothetical protein